jgi:hypothetical protein
VSDATRWLSWSELERLRPYLTHTGLDGQPCVEQDRLEELLRLLDDEEDNL